MESLFSIAVKVALPLPVLDRLASCRRRAAVAAACWAGMVTGTLLSLGGAPCFTVFVARAVLSAPQRLILLVGTETGKQSTFDAAFKKQSPAGFEARVRVASLTRAGDGAESKAEALHRGNFR